jgi:hypothetical protein
MKTKHNKKRNTAFVYEALVREATVAILKKEHEKRDKVVSIIKKHFKPSSLLVQDLQCYRSLCENQNIDQEMAEKIIKEVRMQKMMIDPNGLFKQQTDLIHDINKEVSPGVYNNFVPNYRTLATIDQMFSSKTSPRNKVILEREIVGQMKNLHLKEDADSIDNLAYKTFVDKFNNKYQTTLLTEQKALLTHYISSFADNGLGLKAFLNTEIGRLKGCVEEATTHESIRSDDEMLTKVKRIIEKLQSYQKKGISEDVLMTVLKTQALVEEIQNGDNN